MKRKVVWIITSMLLVVGLLLGLGACTKPAVPSPTPAVPAPEAKTLKIGLVVALNWPIGLDTMHAVTLDIDKVNASGGLLIGKDKYKIDLVTADTKMDLALAKTLAEKIVFDDQVKFILGDAWCSYIPLTEANKVVVMTDVTSAPVYDPSYKYCFQGVVGDTNFPAMISYSARKYPGKKTYVGACPDTLMGHFYGDENSRAAKNAGLQVLEQIYYPATATDLSAMGTKVKTLNPDFFAAVAGGPPGDGMAFKAAYTAGYRGQLIGPSTIPGGVMLGIAGPAALEGFLSMGWPEEFEPAITATAREFKADYIAKYGEWNYPEIVTANEWWILKAGFAKAGSVDPEKVAAVINSGLKYESIGGSGQMISRPDLGLTRTVDTVLGDVPIKQIVGGQVKHIDTMSLEQALELCAEIWGWK